MGLSKRKLQQKSKRIALHERIEEQQEKQLHDLESKLGANDEIGFYVDTSGNIDSKSNEKRRKNKQQLNQEEGQSEKKQKTLKNQTQYHNNEKCNTSTISHRHATMAAIKKINAQKVKRKARKVRNKHSHQTIDKQQTHSKKDAVDQETFDIWETEIPSINQPLLKNDRGYSANIVTAPRKHIRTNIETSHAIETITKASLKPHGGESYNPAEEDRQRLLKKAYEQYQKMTDAEQRLDQRKRGLDIDFDVPALDPLADETNNETTSIVTHRQPGALTKQDRAKKARKLEQQQQLQQKLHRKQVTESFAELPFAIAALYREQDEAAARRERTAQLRAENPRHPRLGKAEFNAPLPSVPLSEELTGSIRVVKPALGAVQHQFLRFQERHLIEPRSKNKFHRKYALKSIDKNKRVKLSHEREMTFAGAIHKMKTPVAVPTM